MILDLGLGLSKALGFGDVAKSFNFESANELPPELTNARTGGAWYQDAQGYLQHEPNSNVARFGTMYGSARGALIEIAMTSQTLYSRPSAGTVSDHLATGDSFTSIVTDSDNPSKDLASGDQVWHMDNSGGGGIVTAGWDGFIASGACSGMAYIKTISGDEPTLKIGATTATKGHTVAGYTLYKIDGVISSNNNLQIDIPAGSVVRVACVNFQPNLGITSFIDNAGSVLTRNGDDLNGSADFWLDVAEGTLVYDFTIYDRSGKTAHYFEARDADIAERFTLWHTGGDALMSTEAGNVVSNNFGIANLNEERVKSAISYADQNIIGSRNGFNFFTDTVSNAPDVSQFNENASPLSFNSINRSGAAPINGIIHRFTLYKTTRTSDQLDALTNPNLPNEFYATAFGDSLFERWETAFSGQPNQRMIDTLDAALTSKTKVVWTNEGKSGSAANYDAAQALAADWWSGQNDIGGGNSFIEALARNVTLTRNATKKFDYVSISLGTNDLRKIGDSTITVAAFKASLQNVIDETIAEYGNVKFIMQNMSTSAQAEYNDEQAQEVRQALREIVAANPSFIGEYDTYDVTRVDDVHPDLNGFNKFVDRQANIILANEGVDTLIEPPQVIGGRWGQNKVFLTCDTSNLSGDDASIFAIDDDGVLITPTSAVISGNEIELTLPSAIADGSVVGYYVGYGKITNVTEANVIRDATTNYPLKTTDRQDNLTFDATILHGG